VCSTCHSRGCVVVLLSVCVCVCVCVCVSPLTSSVSCVHGVGRQTELAHERPQLARRQSTAEHAHRLRKNMTKVSSEPMGSQITNEQRRECVCVCVCVCVTCWNWGEVSVFWISSAVWGRLSPLGRKGRSLSRTSALERMGAIISGVHTLARSTTRAHTHTHTHTYVIRSLQK